MGIIFRLFVKNYQDTGNPAVRGRCIKIAGLVGIATNILLFLIKLLAGLLSNSMALVADAVNNLTDSTTSIVMLAGMKLAEKPADDDHPFGHARIEYITGIIISFVILFLGIQVGISSIGKILHPEEITYTLPTLVIMGISILLKLWQMRFYRRVGAHTASETLLTTAGDSRNDVVATGAILAGALLTLFTGINLDGFLGLGVAAFIVVSGVKFVLETANPLLGRQPDSNLVEKINEKILSCEGVLGYHDLTVHDYGVGRCFASVHCEVPAERDILISHDIIDNLERDFHDSMGIQMVIHLDPVVTNDVRTNALKGQVCAAVKALYPDSSIHDFRVVWGISRTTVMFDVAVPFAVGEKDEEMKRKITDSVWAIQPASRVVLTIDRTSMVYFKEE